jgi:hypothetical protein
MKLYMKNKGIAALVMLVGLTAASCKKGYFYPGINTNPSQLTQPTPSLLLPGVISSTGYVWGGDASRFTSLFMQEVSGAANQSFSYENYDVGTGDVDNMWTNLYGGTGGIMTNANQLITIAAKNGQVHYEAIGKILMANALGLTTDLWGDVPYSQAFQGFNNVNPKYDAQQQVYADMDGLLSDAITELAATDNTTQPGTDDLVYGGNLAEWTGFAHALRAKFFLHLAKVDAANYTKAITEATAAIAAGFSSEKSNAAVPFPGTSSTSQNPWYQFNSTRGDIAFTGYLFNQMSSNKDPRETVNIYGDGTGNPGALYGNPNSPVNLLTYDQLLFIEAEAYFQTGDKNNAATTYNAAVTANLNQTVGNAVYAAGIAKTAANIALSDIMNQKYIASFLDPEVWTDWRRTGYPLLTPVTNGAISTIPRSLLYPVSEVLNNSNTPANTTLARKVWWDK